MGDALFNTNDWNKDVKLSILLNFCDMNNITIRRKYEYGEKAFIRYYFYDDLNYPNARRYERDEVIDDPIRIMNELKEDFKR